MVLPCLIFEPDGALSLTTTDSNYAFDYEDPTPRDQQFSKNSKKKHVSIQLNK